MERTEFIKKWGMVGGRVQFDHTEELESDLNEILKNSASESGGSVSCEAHRPDNAILKSKFTNVYCHAILDDDLRDQQKVDKLWEWIETEILKVR